MTQFLNPWSEDLHTQNNSLYIAHLELYSYATTINISVVGEYKGSVDKLNFTVFIVIILHLFSPAQGLQIYCLMIVLDNV